MAVLPLLAPLNPVKLVGDITMIDDDGMPVVVVDEKLERRRRDSLRLVESSSVWLLLLLLFLRPSLRMYIKIEINSDSRIIINIS